jgi:hypothetical protein
VCGWSASFACSAGEACTPTIGNLPKLFHAHSIANRVDGIGKNQGFVAEEFFFNSLVEHT